MADLVVVGAGGFAREVAFLVDDLNRAGGQWKMLGYIDRDADKQGTAVGNHTILGSEQFIHDYQGELGVVVGIGQPSLIRKVVESLAHLEHVSFPNLIHPSVIMHANRVRFGRGNIVCAGNIFTTDIEVGSFNILNLSCTFGHDCVIGDANVVNPGVNISGGVVIGNHCLLGTGCTILQNKKIGHGVTVGAGALVVKDVPPEVTVVGVPAKILEKASN